MQMIILKTAAIILLFYSLLSRSSVRTPSRIFLLSMIITVFTIYLTKDGIGGLIFSVSGLFTVSIGVLACHLVKQISPDEYLAAAAIGSVVGPIGSFFIIIIIFAMSTIQKMARCESTATMERLLRKHISAEEVISTGKKRADILVKELHWILSAERETSDGTPGIGIKNNETVETRQKIFSWGTKLAMATLAILISGIFI
ncbi:MAG: hypothetical protein JW814_01060 [Candidatus Krumholzibacteriota bacterium]|nr:hypothetical protein [Candidatus Krumholzibacteriota bacterium]